MKTRARLIAIYLPQFHPIPENDLWWGKGFTEWTNVANAKPLFRGHYQPRLPADLGFYDLRVPEVREAQAELARNAGIEGFCYYHYWFNSRRLLERPFKEVVASGKPDFPFCLCWANETWSGVWHGAPERILIEQTYPGPEDHRNHFFSLLDAFRDSRYMGVDGRPIFAIYRPSQIPRVREFISQWQDLAVQNGLPGMHFVAHLPPRDANWDFRSQGFDSCVVVSTMKGFATSARNLFGRIDGNASREAAERAFGVRYSDNLADEMRHWAWRRSRALFGQFSNVRLYEHVLPFLLDGCTESPDVYPCVTPNWDNSARVGRRAYVLHESNPELFRLHLRNALSLVDRRPAERSLVFIKSWNEWAEGNYLEPDQRFGLAYLNVIQQEVLRPRLTEREPAAEANTGEVQQPPLIDSAVPVVNRPESKVNSRG